jgi:hypothetical protein
VEFEDMRNINHASTLIQTAAISSCLFICFFLFSNSYDESTPDQYLHKNARLGLGGPSEDIIASSVSKPISPRQAAFFAVQHLEKKGVKEILVCESHWIAAPISGYLVDCQGKMRIDNKNFTVFRIGIRDGLEAHHGKESQAGIEFVFMALGRGKNGERIWHPEPGPDFRLKQGEAVPDSFFIYEFLLYREEFESLPIRYPND